jgi:arginase/N-omega-hydroxy-L-arginine amidinohydrolase
MSERGEQMYHLILSQGRLADRKAGTLDGAARTAQLLERHLGVTATQIGQPAPPRDDDWRQSLAEARETLDGLAGEISWTLAIGQRPIMVANTCSASLASLPIAARAFPDLALLWIDAHGDFNTPATTGSGYLGGMVVSAACGLWHSGHGTGLDSRRVVVVGGRDIDPDEARLMTDAGVRVLSPAQATAHAVSAAIGEAPIWIHVDWDVMEPGHVPADYAVPDGLLPEQLRAIFEAIPSGQVKGVELAEYHPPNDPAADKACLAKILSIVTPLFATEPVL